MGKPRVIFALAAAVATSSCTILHPYPSMPPSSTYDGTFPSAVRVLDTVSDELDSDLNSTDTIRSVTGLGTYAGFGGAAISAVARASTDVILGFATLGAASFTTGGVYGSATQSSIYNAGRAALGCVGTTIAPVRAADQQLRDSLKRIQDDVDAVTKQLATTPAKPRPSMQLADARDKIVKAGMAVANAQPRLREANAYSAKIIDAVRQIVQSVYDQLLKNLPDPAALARAGTSIGTATLTANTAAQDLAHSMSQEKQAKIAAKIAGGPRGEEVDPVLEQEIDALESDIEIASQITAEPRNFPALSCSVANVTITPITIAGATNNSVTVTQGAKASFAIFGGTPPYTKADWEGDKITDAQKTTVTIMSPNLLQFDATGANVVAGTYQLRIYDSSNSANAMAKPLTVVVQGKATQKSAGLSLQNVKGSTVELGLGKTVALTIQGGSGSYAAVADTKAHVTVSVAGKTLTLATTADTVAGSFSLTVSDATDTSVAPLKLTLKIAKPGLSLRGQSGRTIVLAPGQVTAFTIEGGSGSYDAGVGTDAPLTANVAGATLTLTVAANAPVGSYKLTISDKADASISPLQLTVQVK